MAEGERTRLAQALLAEIKKLRWGRGLHAPNLAHRTGPYLYELVALADVIDRSVLERELAELLRSVSGPPLTPDRTRLALVALGMSSRLAGNGYRERIQALAHEVDRDPRTVQRWVDAAHETMALLLADRLLAARRSTSQQRFGWNVEQLVSSLSFESPKPVLVERRDIVVTDQYLSGITVNLSLGGNATAEDVPEVTAIEGCRVQSVNSTGGKYWMIELGFPRVLRSGEVWSYEVAFTFPRAGVMAPFYGFMPHRRSERFSTEVVFARASQVAVVYSLIQVTQTVIMDPAEAAAAGVPLELSGNRVSLECKDLRQGFCYGLRWVWAEPPE
jgi:hypothetical protein